MTMEHCEAIENVVHKVHKVNRKFDLDTDQSQVSFLTDDQESPANKSWKFDSDNKHRLENECPQSPANVIQDKWVVTK